MINAYPPILEPVGDRDFSREESPFFSKRLEWKSSKV